MHDPHIEHTSTASKTPLIGRSFQILAAVGLIAGTTLSLSAQQLEPPQSEPAATESATTQRATQTRTRGRATPEEMISFGAFSEPMELTTLIDYVGSSLNINIAIKGTPTGEIVFNAPKQIAKSKLIDFLDAMLELYAFTISFDPDSKYYIVQPITDLKPVFGAERASTLIIPTPNIKPSLLTTALSTVLGSTSTGGSSSSTAIQAIDELGVLIVNAPPRDIRRVEMMVAELLRLDANQEYIRFELDHLAAPIALDRVNALVGGSGGSGSRTATRANNPNQPANTGISASGAGGSLSNLTERLTVDPQGNALIFKGTDNEIARVRKVLAVIDVPNTLEPKNYFAGSSATQIADIAKRRGLGEVIQIEATQGQNPFNNFGGQNQQFNQQSSNLQQGGPVMVVDPERGNIIYYGTDDQQAQLSALLAELKTEDERVVIREYVLNHTDALTISELLNGIISGELQTGTSDLLQGAAGRTNTNRTFINGFPLNTGDGESGGDFNPDLITVIPDEFSNQVIIKAPIKQQEDLEKLITRLDKRRPQVYIQATIVSIADNEDFTLAFETQINAGQYSAGSNFGLSSPGATFADPKLVATGLGGLTQAVIMSEYVPLIVNATQTNINGRILSMPQLLVNDNEESTIVSIEEQPFSQVSQGDGGNVTAFGGTIEAGTTLTVTPSISANGSVRLEYNIELSNFIGTGADNLPPPTNRRTLTGSVTVPSDATIVLGGITVDDIRDTVMKVPLLGDIPLVGELFKRTNKVNNKSKLYVFLTPRVMNDPNFNDLKLFSEGPQSEVEIDPGPPELEPAAIFAPNKKKSKALPESTPVSSAIEPSAEDNSIAGSAPELEPVFIELTEVNTEGGE